MCWSACVTLMESFRRGLRAYALWGARSHRRMVPEWPGLRFFFTVRVRFVA